MSIGKDSLLIGVLAVTGNVLFGLIGCFIGIIIAGILILITL